MRTLFLSIILACSAAGLSQQKDPVKWSARYASTGEKTGEIHITGTIEKGWHTYSQRATDAGPVPTRITLAPSEQYKASGEPEEMGAVEELDPAFEAKLFVFHEKAEFKQKINLSGQVPLIIPITVEYMSCNNMMCLPPKTVSLQVQVLK